MNLHELFQDAIAGICLILTCILVLFAAAAADPMNDIYDITETTE